MEVNKHQRSTLAKIFETPTRRDIGWSEIESLFTALGAVTKGSGGSRVGVKLAGRYAVFHRPHPQPTTDKGTVERVRAFLDKAGVQP